MLNLLIENGLILDLFVALVWVIYLLAFLFIRFNAQKTASPLSVTVRFKVLNAVTAILHVVAYAYYMFGRSSVLNIPTYSLLFWGIILVACGLILSIIAYYQVRKYGLELPATPRGVYKVMRWPVYSGLIILWFGIALIFNSNPGIILGIVLLIPLIYYQVKSEEKNIMETLTAQGLGESYQHYLKNSWALFPKFF